MSQYTKSTNFATKDNLTPGDPLKIVRGTEIDTEYNNIATAIATKTDNASAAITGGTINATTIGATTASTGAFSTLSATGAITSTLATGTAPLVIASTTKVANLNVDSLDGADWASPAALGSTTPAAVSATTLTTSSTVTFNGGTANGVAYLNGSKVVTSGTALWFDGTNFGVGTGGNTLNQQSVVYKAGANTVYQQIANGSTGLGATNGIRVGVSSAGVGEWYSPTAAISYIDNTEQMRLTSTGLGIGTSSPAYKLDVQTANSSNPDGITVRSTSSSSSAGAQLILNGYGNSWGIICGSTAKNSNALTFSLDALGTPSEKMRLDTSGNLLVGTTSATAKFTVESSSLVARFTQTSAAGVAQFKNGSDAGYGLDFLNVAGSSVGAIYWTSTVTTYATSSDYRLKNSIAPMTGALAKVAQLKPVTYKWNADGSNGQGFIAHELAEVCPDAVTGEKDAVDAQGNPQYQGIDVSFLVATLTAAIKEQQAIIELLKARLDAANL